MKELKSCCNCSHYEMFYILNSCKHYFEPNGRGMCKQKNKVVGDKYYCENHKKG